MKAQLTLDGGDVLTVERDAHTRMWISPCNGEQHLGAILAMATELRAYFGSICEAITDEEVSDLMSKIVID